MTLSAVLIVKNEQEVLPQCLDSIKGVDELVIVDTGSTDKTVEIAKNYGAKIDYFQWCDSFAKARNYALSKATGDWILSIDADEHLVCPIENVRRAIENTKEDILNVTLTSGKTSHNFPRLFKRTPEIFWKGDIHNYLSKVPKEHSGIEIVYGYSPAHKKDPDRALRILEKSVKKDDSLVREKYYLAREYYYRKQYQKCMDMLDKYLEVGKWRPEIAEVYLMKARCLWQLQQGEEARVACMYAIMTNPDFKEALEFMAEMNYEPRKSKWLEYADLANNQDVLFVRATNLPMDLDPEYVKYMENLLDGDVLEWGIGKSTKYFTDKLREKGVKFTWTGIEHNKEWFDRVSKWNTGAKLILADKDSREYLEPRGKYDVIYIDGRNRVKCLQSAKKLLKPGGIVLLHDAQRGKYHAGFEGYDWKYIGDKQPLLWQGSPML